jgi:hypothetical protein
MGVAYPSISSATLTLVDLRDVLLAPPDVIGGDEQGDGARLEG